MADISLLKIRRFIKISIYLFIFSFPLVFAKGKKCILNEISLKKEHLACMKKNEKTKILVENLKGVKKALKECPSCRGPFPGARKFYESMGPEFLSIALSDNGFGGYTFYGAFKRDASLYKIWVYDLGEGEYHVRAATPQSKIKEDLSKDSEIKDFWIEL